MEENAVPQLLRTNLSHIVLLLLSLGIDNLIDFCFIDAPPLETLLCSPELLYALGALNDKGKLTKLGHRMAELPLEPMMVKALLASEKYKCSEEVTVIWSMSSVNNAVFYRPKPKKMMTDAARAAFARGGGGDHMPLLRCYAQWRDAGFSNHW
ncbi:Pre-mRNA-splicing factor ATP-dependent RNA helicase DEAH1 [Gracilariopsis chorda]|uniref:Pre-mRNA-splicing factor ATP-dependent RNA helicase DEAH1 n=1 Tax=Gracilariopsis chorda TaxID=448386 RepID=A0A2V3IMV3_9FLOR|nr:Pre-mRNA-splicing factor ATP-dependent RNA helicase DEAH1 [Gracilariopsis chorda]|eukprot:PXF43414.1 Pre-mRNA-splicing factor ATP-dependent RNA helicase DEAH1 [Gracilariopsis chorda]